MEALPFILRLETPGDAAAVEALNEFVFGPGRFTRTAYRLREGVPHDDRLSLVAENASGIVGSVRLTPILIGGEDALLLGPICFHPDWQNRGGGKAMIRHAIDAARAHGHRLVLLVGDEPYYGQFGFRRVPPGRIVMPGPVDLQRVLLAELVPGAAAEVSGRATRIG